MVESVVDTYLEGLIGQVVNFPPDLRIETWLHQTCPELRGLQEATLRTNMADLQLGLDSWTRRVTPEVIFQASTSLNAGYCAYIARLLGAPELAQPFRSAGWGKVGDELAEEVWQTQDSDYNQDRRDTNRWAVRFGLREWFSWRRYPS